jgi:hypothetical protein
MAVCQRQNLHKSKGLAASVPVATLQQLRFIAGDTGVDVDADAPSALRPSPQVCTFSAESRSMNFETIQPLTLVAGMALLTWLMMRRRVKRTQSEMPVKISKHHENMPGDLAGFQGTGSLGAPPEVLRWQVELHDMARELKAELDSKMLAVTSLAKSYEQASKRLSDLIRMAEEVELSPTSPLAKAQELRAAGWEDSRIAEMLGIQPHESPAFFTVLAPIHRSNSEAA